MAFSVPITVREEELETSLSSAPTLPANYPPKSKPLRREGALHGAAAFVVRDSTPPLPPNKPIPTRSGPSSIFHLTLRLALDIVLQFIFYVLDIFLVSSILLLVFSLIVFAAFLILGFIAFVIFPQVEFQHVDVRYSVQGVSGTLDLVSVREYQAAFRIAREALLNVQAK